MYQNLNEQAEYIKNNFSKTIEILSPIENQNLIIYVDKNHIEDFLTFLRDDDNLSFKSLIDLFGADMLGIRSPRFEIIYNLLSYKLNNRITIKVKINDNEDVPSVYKIYSCANWFEREAFDMYGIKFTNHPDLRRILTDYNFEGYPLRKDFPLTGFKEVRYDEKQQQVIYEDVKLMQEFRNFDFEMPWEGATKKIQK
jgi:NADH-quinone oxidoreductase subunit C